MAIPKYDEMYRECLEVLSDEKEHKVGAMRDLLANIFGVSDEERKEMLPSGKQPMFNNRVNWTCTYLKRAGLIETTTRGVYRITAQGKAVQQQNPPRIDNTFLERFASFRAFIDMKHEAPNANNNAQQADPSQTPQDTLDAAYEKINAALMEDLLAEIMAKPPEFFEHMVVKLLKQMGYGGSLDDAGTVTPISGDEGIDGLIREDKLGFSTIYIQAKRWDRTATVGRPELQKFVGALAGQGATKGLFITTAKFTKEAKDYAKKQHTTKIVLVDGETLARLMIEYNLGVSVETTYEIKRIDSDFFDDSLN